MRNFTIALAAVLATTLLIATLAVRVQCTVATATARLGLPAVPHTRTVYSAFSNGLWSDQSPGAPSCF